MDIVTVNINPRTELLSKNYPNNNIPHPPTLKHGTSYLTTIILFVSQLKIFFQEENYR